MTPPHDANMLMIQSIFAGLFSNFMYLCESPYDWHDAC
jgi:hypothetical protein